MADLQLLIKQLNLATHPEGGYYRETYRSELSVPGHALPSEFGDDRNICTSIYFLLPSDERSLMHRIKSDELWHYHAGSALHVYVIHEGKLTIHRLGPDYESGEKFQLVIPANSWFGAMCEVDDSFTLAGCTVSPGFDFRDFEMGRRSDLLKQFPQFEREIIALTT